MKTEQACGIGSLAPNWMKRSAASNIATVTAVTFFYPLEIIKTRSQIQGEIINSRKRYAYNIKNLAKIIQAEGIDSLYRGFSISIICIPVFNTIYFPIYGECKQAISKSTGWKEGDIRMYTTSAGLAGTICNILTNPLWLVRTRMQAEIFQNESKVHYKDKYGRGIFSIVNN